MTVAQKTERIHGLAEAPLVDVRTPASAIWSRTQISRTAPQRAAVREPGRALVPGVSLGFHTDPPSRRSSRRRWRAAGAGTSTTDRRADNTTTRRRTGPELPAGLDRRVQLRDQALRADTAAPMAAHQGGHQGGRTSSRLRVRGCSGTVLTARATPRRSTTSQGRLSEHHTGRAWAGRSHQDKPTSSPRSSASSRTPPRRSTKGLFRTRTGAFAVPYRENMAVWAS